MDMFCHWLPRAYLDRIEQCLNGLPMMFQRAADVPVMVDLAARFRVMDQFPGYRQVPCMVSPNLEVFTDPDMGAELARAANDVSAELTGRHPDRFPGWVATLALHHPEAALREAERAVKELGAAGVQVFTNVHGLPIDRPQFQPIFELMAELDRPIWLHPSRGMKRADYPDEEASRYELWWALGWPYETSMAMYRLVFAGVFERWPALKIITHHGGGMIPMVEGRLGPGLELYGTRTPRNRRELIETPLSGKPLDSFRRFYSDTATFGSRAAIECSLAFFGIDRLLFASDMPFDPEFGPGYIRAGLQAIEEMDLSTADREKILCGNALRLIGS